MRRRGGARRRRRIRRIFLVALRRSFPHLGRFTPSLSARLAEEIFRTPPKHAPLRREECELAAARFSRVPGKGGVLPVWTWGEGPPVLLVHGWGGHAGRLTPFVRPLVEAGLSVVAFDAPGHGGAPGRYSSLPDFVEAIRTVALGQGAFEAMIGHSLGAAACALAVREGLPVSRIVLLAPPAEAEKYTGRFARFFRIPPETHAAMKLRLERRYRIRWSDLRVTGGECSVRVLVFHDPRDGKVPFRDGEEVVRTWPNAKLVATSGLGHHRILSNPKVIADAVRFVSGASGVPAVERQPCRARLGAAFAS